MHEKQNLGTTNLNLHLGQTNKLRKFTCKTDDLTFATDLPANTLNVRTHETSIDMSRVPKKLTYRDKKLFKLAANNKLQLKLS